MYAKQNIWLYEKKPKNMYVEQKNVYKLNTQNERKTKK